MRQSPWRLVAFSAALVIAVTWSVASGWYVSQSWPLRQTMARIELAREEIAWLFGADVAWRLGPKQLRQLRDWITTGCSE